MTGLEMAQELVERLKHENMAQANHMVQAGRDICILRECNQELLDCLVKVVNRCTPAKEDSCGQEMVQLRAALIAELRDTIFKVRGRIER